MAKVLTFSSTIGLVNFDGLYLIGYAWLFGMCELNPCFQWPVLTFECVEAIWISFFGGTPLAANSYSYLSNVGPIAGVIAYKNLRALSVFVSCMKLNVIN